MLYVSLANIAFTIKMNAVASMRNSYNQYSMGLNQTRIASW